MAERVEVDSRLTEADRLFLPICLALVLMPFIAWAFDAAAHWVVWMLLWGGGAL